MKLKNLPRLELTKDPNKEDDFVIYRYSTKTKTYKKSKLERKNKTHRNKTHRNKKKKHNKSNKGLFGFMRI